MMGHIAKYCRGRCTFCKKAGYDRERCWELEKEKEKEEIKEEKEKGTKN